MNECSISDYTLPTLKACNSLSSNIISNGVFFAFLGSYISFLIKSRVAIRPGNPGNPGNVVGFYFLLENVLGDDPFLAKGPAKVLELSS